MRSVHIIATAERARFLFTVVSTWRHRPLSLHSYELRSADEALDRLLQELKSGGQRPKSILWLLGPDRYLDRVFSLPVLAQRDVAAGTQRLFNEWLGTNTHRFLLRWRRVMKTTEEVRVYASATRSETVAALLRAGSGRGIVTRGVFGVAVALSTATADGVAAHIDGERTLILAAAGGLPVQTAAARIDGSCGRVQQLCRQMRGLADERGQTVSERPRLVLAGVPDDGDFVRALGERGFCACSLTRFTAGLLRMPADLNFAPARRMSPKSLGLILALIVGLQGSALLQLQQRSRDALVDLHPEALESGDATTVAGEIDAAWREVDQIRQRTEQLRRALESAHLRPDWTQIHRVVSERSAGVSVYDLSARKESGGRWMIRMSAAASSLSAVPEFERQLREVFESAYMESLTLTGSSAVSFDMKMRWCE